MAKFRNVTHKPLPVDLKEESLVVMPGYVFEARPNIKVIKDLIEKNKIVRVYGE